MSTPLAARLAAALTAALLLAAPATAQDGRPHAPAADRTGSAPTLGLTPPPPLTGALQSPLRGLPPPGRGFAVAGLPPAGDPTPVCRASCAAERFACEAHDDGACVERWTQCVRDCSGPQGR